MPFYKRRLEGFKFTMRVEDLAASDLVTERCIICEFKRVVSPWQLHARNRPEHFMRGLVGRECPECGYPTLIWGVVRAVSDSRLLPKED